MHTFNDLFTALNQQRRSLDICGLRGGAMPMLAARTAGSLKRPVLCLAPTEQQAAILEQDLNFFTDLPVFFYPGYDIPPYTPLSPDPATVAARLSCLYRLISSESPFILVASIEAMHRRTLPRQKLSDMAELVLNNEELDRNHLAERLVSGGYERVSLVRNVGEFSLRGGIMDIFPPTFVSSQTGIRQEAPELPLRLDFFGDMVESIRYFEPITQRSVASLQEAVLLPVSDIVWPPVKSGAMAEIVGRFRQQVQVEAEQAEELDGILERIESRQTFPGIEFFLPLFYEAPATVFDYLPAATVVFAFEPSEIERTANLVRERIEANYLERHNTGNPALTPKTLFLSEPELQQALSASTLVSLYDFTTPAQPGAEPSENQERPEVFDFSCGNHKLIKQELELQRKKQGVLAPVADIIHRWLAQGDRIIYACRSERHGQQVAQMLERYELETTVTTEAALIAGDRGLAPAQDRIMILGRPLSEGFDLPAEKLHVLSEIELFGSRKLAGREKKKDSRAGSVVSFEELQLGDIVVHRDHGLGSYAGLINLALQGVTNDFLQILYHDGDKLYVPVDRINTVNKYKGLSDKEPHLDRLGSKTWAKTKQKVKEEVWKVAGDLLDLYARRQLIKGHSFSQPDDMYRELEESFPYDETAGQTKAINEVITDLTAERTMDRLVCGDVGFGKTEVAIRAAFKVIGDSQQVAVLVPTTVLAEQHLETFRERFRGFPVRVASLNRFRTRAEQKEILTDLAAGRIDVVIGTHRLLSQDVSFSRLGLLIIDEEHRFGVAHKEKLKKLRTRVDVLTLTATPIPRTLQLSLLGVRDLSVISSPPQHRRTIKTFVARHDDLVIKEAISRELIRGGQVFLIHNRVQSIHEVARKVQMLVPEARISVAHGQMPGKNLEEIMVNFVNRELDVLVCTTIVESGLDIPNANTIIITRADRLGLAEIYQLRGRVGRSQEQAYAYLLVPSLDGLSKDARQRLRALMDYNELGGGFKLAMSDLQIRGGGNILGKSQSGTIAAVGYDLYLDLLQKTVDDLKQAGEGATPGGEEEIEPEITLNISAFIPKEFIEDADQRYLAYRRISNLQSREEINDMEAELRDRYGALPAETANLLEVIALKIKLRLLKITRLERGPISLVFTFHHQTPVKPERLLLLVKNSRNRMRFTPDSKLVVTTAPELSPQEIMVQAHKIIADLH